MAIFAVLFPSTEELVLTEEVPFTEEDGEETLPPFNASISDVDPQPATQPLFLSMATPTSIWSRHVVYAAVSDDNFDADFF